MDVNQLDEAMEITMRTKRKDGSWSSRPIWIVVVDDEAYVRSARGAQGEWYRKVRSGGQAEIAVDGQTLAVSLEPVHDESLNEQVTDAYRAKYAADSPGSTEALTEGEPTTTTMRVAVPA
jgi:hypothetical protein